MLTASDANAYRLTNCQRIDLVQYTTSHYSHTSTRQTLEEPILFEYRELQYQMLLNIDDTIIIALEFVQVPLGHPPTWLSLPHVKWGVALVEKMTVWFKRDIYWRIYRIQFHIFVAFVCSVLSDHEDEIEILFKEAYSSERFKRMTRPYKFSIGAGYQPGKHCYFMIIIEPINLPNEDPYSNKDAPKHA